MKLRIALADDEPIARMRLRTMLERENDVEIVAVCGDGRELCQQVAAYMPDLVLTDIEMWVWMASRQFCACHKSPRP